MRYRVALSILPLLSSLGCGGATSPLAEQDFQPVVEPSRAAAESGHGSAGQTSGAEAGGPAREAAGEELETSSVTAANGPRIGALAHHVWIQPKPTSEGLALGKLRIGTSVRLRSSEVIPGGGCSKGWYGVEPRGYVCLNESTTLDLKDPLYRALNTLAPAKGVLFPYSYAYSRDAPMYSRVPTPDEWEKAERAFGKAGTWADLGPWAKGHEELLGDWKIEATDDVPWYFKGGKRQVRGGVHDAKKLVWKVIPNGSMLAYGKAFEMHGRVWLVTPDLTLVPADRVQPIRRSEFHGVELGGEVTLPLAWNRDLDPIVIYRKDGAGQYRDSGEKLAGKGWVEIEDIGKGKFSMFGLPHKYFELRARPGLYLKREDITISRARDELPKAFKSDERWIDIKITPGTLTVYDGLTPIYATLFSPGKGGHPVDGNDHTVYATTQVGYFRLEWKDHVATMSNEKGDPQVLWFSDVPHIQYIRAPLAMHVSYWHEDFSNPKSAECVNLSPADGRWMFEHTEPKLPEDWGAVRPGDGMGTSTAMMINGF